ncbi:MAG TPA: nuclear transport factor 2 family protein [bacterium]|nr:nuclear transport factor 2 family protein [bacterium]
MSCTKRSLFAFSILGLFVLACSAASAGPLYDDQCYPAVTNTEGMNPFDRLEAVEEIKKTKARYFRCMDNKDWDCFQDTMTDDIDFNVSGALYALDESGNAHKSGDVVIDPNQIDQSFWQVNGAVNVRFWEAGALTGAQTMHQGHMPEVTLTSPDTAVACFTLTHHLRFPMFNPFAGTPLESFLPSQPPHPELFGYGFYREEYERGNDGKWRISHLRFHTFRVDITYQR